MSELRGYIKTLKERGLSISFRELKSLLFRGPRKKALNNLLNLFSKHDVKFTFFIVGKTAESYPKIIRNIIEHGHEIGAHGYLHKRMDLMNREEIKEDLSQEIKLFKEFKYELRGFRAPYLKSSKTLMDTIKSLGFKYSSSVKGIKKFRYENKLLEQPISFDDWEMMIKKGHTARDMFKIINKNIRERSVLLLHPSRIGQKSNIKCLEKFIKRNKKKYEFTNLSNLRKNSIALTGDIGELALWDLFRRLF